MVKPVRLDVSGDGVFLNLRPTLTTSEAAKALGVSLRTARGYVTKGLLTAVQVGRAYRIRTESVEHMLTVGTVAIREDLSRPSYMGPPIPERDVDKDRFRARLINQLMEKDAARSDYLPIIC